MWRVDSYLKDAGGQCDNCGRIWQDVRKQKELLIEKNRQLLEHLSSLGYEASDARVADPGVPHTVR